MSERFAHVCQDGHQAIGHNDSEHELCPLCRMNLESDVQAQIAALVSAVTARNAQLAAISEQIRAGFEGLNKEVQFIRGYTEAANENVAGLAERLSAIEKQGARISAQQDMYFEKLAAIESQLEKIWNFDLQLRPNKTMQAIKNQSLGGKQRRRKER